MYFSFFLFQSFIAKKIERTGNWIRRKHHYQIIPTPHLYTPFTQYHWMKEKFYTSVKYRAGNHWIYFPPAISKDWHFLATFVTRWWQRWSYKEWIIIWVSAWQILTRTYISWFSDFALYLEYYLLVKCHTWDISSMWPNEWPLTISRSLWPIFHGSVILPYILNTICWINVTPGILLPCDPMNDHLLYLGHCDLYFMVQWFCLISWILFVG